MLNQGCQRIAHLVGHQHPNIFKLRRQGYGDALREQGIPVLDEYILICDIKMEDGTVGMKQLLALSQPPDAVFPASNLFLVGALEVLKEQGLRVPQNVGLAGFSNELFACLTDPKLTSIDLHCELMGKSTTCLLLQIMEEQVQHFTPRRVMLQPNLCVRASSQRQLL